MTKRKKVTRKELERLARVTDEGSGGRGCQSKYARKRAYCLEHEVVADAVEEKPWCKEECNG
jgi:hypothetical protein